MKFYIYLLVCFSSTLSFGQCVNLYVKEHLDGDPICRLSAGSTLEICLDTKTINGGACTFYIQSSRMNGDVQTYEFGLDKTTMYFYAPKYGDLIINTKTKKFGFVIDNNSGAYSYYNQAEIQKIREIEKIEKDNLEKSNKEMDKLTINKIYKLINLNNLELASKEYNNLKIENREIKQKIETKLNEVYKDSIVLLDQAQIENYIRNYLYNKKAFEKDKLLREKKGWAKSNHKLPSLESLKPGVYIVKFNQFGQPTNEGLNLDTVSNYFGKLDPLIEKSFGILYVYLKSKATFKIEEKDSVLVSITYSTSNTKTLYIDKNENFYYKTKTGLPVATISNDPSIDKKLIRINKVYKREKYANGILIDTQEFRTEKTVVIQKKDQ